MTSGTLTEGLNPPRREIGVHADLPFDDYLALPYVSQSTLKPMLVSPAHYKHALDNPPDPDKDCFRFGRLCHTGKLEGTEKLMAGYVLRPDFAAQVMEEKPETKSPKHTSRYKELVAEFETVNADKEVIDGDYFRQLCGILEALNRHHLAREWLTADGPSELSLIWREPLTGLHCKSRLDKLPHDADLVVDLKTTGRDITGFEFDLESFGYDVQAAFYSDAMYVLTGRSMRFAIVVVERNPPHSVRAAVVDEDTMAAGRWKYRRALRRLAACRERNRWPGPADPPTWSIPSDRMPTVELTGIGGEPITF